MTRIRALRADLSRRYPRLATAGWLLTGLVGALWLLALVAVLVGLALGMPGPDDPAPSVDFDDEPAAVVATAARRLDHRDYTVEEWVRRIDRQTGGVSGGMFYRFHVENSRGQLRGTIQPAGPYGSYGFVGEEPATEVFVADGAAWVRLQYREYWQRSAPAGNLTTEVLAPLNVTRERLDDATVSVVANNETVWVADVPAADAPGVDGAGTVRYVVARGEDPHLRQVRIERPGRLERETRVIRVTRYGETRAIRPEGVPWTTVGELHERAVRGLGRIL